MRLTLRSLLAYLDDILEPADAEEISKKVAESPVATNLLHRIRDVTKRLRLGAPNVLDRGAGLDPNTVAEYLDHSLPAGQVPDFEKVCLESDVQLAEVASCHQVLAMVLGEPAEVDPDSRQRIYQLPDLVAATRAAAAASGEPVEVLGPVVPTVVEPPGISKPEPHATRPPVPDYVAPAAAPPKWKTVVGLAVVLLIAVGLLWLGGLFRPSRSGEDLSQGTPTDEGPAPPAVRGPAAPAAPAPQAGPLASLPQGQAAPKPPLGAGQAGEGASRAGPMPGAPEGPPIARPGPIAGKTPGPEPPGEPVGAAGPKPGPQPPTSVAGPAVPVPPKPPAEAALPPPQPIGLFTTPKQALLRLDPQAAAWYRVADRAVIGSYDRLLALPAFRPVVVLAGRIQMELVDGTLVQFLPVESPGTVGVLLEHGRLVFKADEAGSRLRLRVGDRVGLITLEAAGSVVAVEAFRLEGPGDPETQPGPVSAYAYLLSGKVTWQEEPQGKRVSLAGPERLALGVAAGNGRTPRQAPRWITDDTASSLEKRAALVLERSLVPDRLAGDELMQMTKRPQREVRWLAVRSLVLAGEFKPILDGLSNLDQKSLWPDYIELLRSAVILGPQSAAAARTAMEKAYGPEGASLYEMLWRYRGDAVRPQEAAQLVAFLDHEELIFRILSFWNLKNIKAGMTLSYRPEDPYSKRQLAVQRWRDRLRSDPALRGKVPAVEERGRGPAISPPGEEEGGEKGPEPKASPSDGGTAVGPSAEQDRPERV